MEVKFKSELDFGVTVNGGSFSGGLHWIYISPSGEELSVILHAGSYGRHSGTFEIMPSWNSIKCNKDSVIGGLSFGEVQEWIDTFIGIAKRESCSK
jgi:hypothetical protein